MAAGARVGVDEWYARVEKEKDAKDDIDVSEAEINVCFSTTGSCLSRWIRGYTGSPVSHAMITFRSLTLNRVVVMQASGHGFQIVPWSRWQQKNILVARFRFKAEDRAQLLAMRAVARHLGAGYDLRGLVGFVPGMWFRVADWVSSRWRVRKQGSGDSGKSVLPRFRNWLDNPEKLFCSEAVAEFFYHCVDKKKFARPPDWSPKNLLDFATDPDSPLEKVPDRLNQGPTRRRQDLLPARVWEKAKVKAPPPAEQSDQQSAAA